MNENIATTVGHALRTPLTAIYGFSQLLDSEKVQNSDEIRKYYIELICKNSERLNNTIIDLQEILESHNINLDENEKNKLLGIQELQIKR